MVVSVREHNGVTYLEHSVTPVDVVSTTTFKDQKGKLWKLKMDGPAAIVEERGSWKYGHQFHVTVHCNPMHQVLQAANDSIYRRNEIATSWNMGVQWLQRGLDSVHDGRGKLIDGETSLDQVI